MLILIKLNKEDREKFTNVGRLAHLVFGKKKICYIDRFSFFQSIYEDNQLRIEGEGLEI